MKRISRGHSSSKKDFFYFLLKFFFSTFFFRNFFYFFSTISILKNWKKCCFSIKFNFSKVLRIGCRNAKIRVFNNHAKLHFQDLRKICQIFLIFFFHQNSFGQQKNSIEFFLFFLMKSQKVLYLTNHKKRSNLWERVFLMI